VSTASDIAPEPRRRSWRSFLGPIDAGLKTPPARLAYPRPGTDDPEDAWMYLALELRYEIENALDTASEMERNELRVLVRAEDWKQGGGARHSDGVVKTVLDALQRAYLAEADEMLPGGSTEELRTRIRDRVG
jgi:hypothetical protein